MIIQCKSCNKKFTVPDSAITSKGRLVQCSSCGNQWTQYPIAQKKKITPPIVKKSTKSSPSKRKKTKDIDVYSDEYLQKKHGIKIIDPSSINKKTIQNKTKSKLTKKASSGLGFYSYLVLFSVSIIFLFGTLNLTRDILIYNYPFLESYITYFYETLNNISLIISDMISNY
jgi:predicted Zn finger-like uncharacterized protein